MHGSRERWLADGGVVPRGPGWAVRGSLGVHGTRWGSSRPAPTPNGSAEWTQGRDDKRRVQASLPGIPLRHSGQCSRAGGTRSREDADSIHRIHSMGPFPQFPTSEVYITFIIRSNTRNVRGGQCTASCCSVRRHLWHSFASEAPTHGCGRWSCGFTAEPTATLSATSASIRCLRGGRAALLRVTPAMDT